MGAAGRLRFGTVAASGAIEAPLGRVATDS